MVIYKTAEEIELLRLSNLMTIQAIAEVAKNIKPGISTLKLDKIAHDFIFDNHGVPAFLGYDEFPNTLCISVNEQVVHGIPSKYELKEGDLVSIDCGVLLNRFFGDAAYSFPVGQADKKVLNLLKVTKEALFKGIEAATEGRKLGAIGNAVQTHVEQNGYNVVRTVYGHGIGQELHEFPDVPNFGNKRKGIELKRGMVLAIEPMVTSGKKDVYTLDDDWTIVTKDKSLAAHFELSVAITNDKAEILAPFDAIELIMGEKLKTNI